MIVDSHRTSSEESLFGGHLMLRSIYSYTPLSNNPINPITLPNQKLLYHMMFVSVFLVLFTVNSDVRGKSFHILFSTTVLYFGSVVYETLARERRVLTYMFASDMITVKTRVHVSVCTCVSVCVFLSPTHVYIIILIK